MNSITLAPTLIRFVLNLILVLVSLAMILAIGWQNASFLKRADAGRVFLQQRFAPLVKL